MRRPNLSDGSDSLFSPAAKAGAPATRPYKTGRHIVVFRKGAVDEAVQMLRAAGLKVVNSDESQYGVVREDRVGDADAIVFPRLGMALVAAAPEKVLALSKSASDASSPVRSVRPEKVRYALPYSGNGLQVQEGLRQRSDYSPGGNEAQAGDYLYTGAASTPAAAFDVSHLVDESQFTYGLQLTRAVESTYSGRGVRVAVLDTGIELSIVPGTGGVERVEYHPDFAGRTIVAESFVPGARTAKDGNGHGTHCVGTACGPREPATKPGYGVAYGAEIYVGKVLDDTGSGADAWILSGIEWALKNRCRVISMSFGSAVEPGEGYDDVYEQVALRALEAGTLLVAAAGNDSVRPGEVAPVTAPANCPSIFAVAAVDSDLRPGYFSNGGINPNGGEVNIAAPGVAVYSSYLAPTLHTTISGTSMAAPHVAGIAALYAEADPGAMGKQLWDALARDARVLPLPPRDVGAGLVQAPTGPATAHDQPRRRGVTHDPIIIDGGSASIDFNHEAFIQDPLHPERFFSEDLWINGLIIRNNETGVEHQCPFVPDNGQCTITVHCDYQGFDRPFVVSGRLIQINFDVAEYVHDRLRPRVHKSHRRRITSVEVRDDRAGGTTHVCEGVPTSGLCTIHIAVGHS